ncbi:hypothetical protein QAD02_001486 [Eretmocerus hayati]|uniref:Uncharacterized protein n=1 Tax=Eretmocerus hayati TaxID=131215 RepID=A0ACC2NJ06_9HYME|nr:hypothetical protein QAD02_001486 [Eretmocerus hayati]
MNNNQNMSNTVGVTFEFFRSSSESKQEKIKDFWKYLDSQNILTPVRALKVNAKTPGGDTCSRDDHSSSQTAPVNVKKIPVRPKSSTKKSAKQGKCYDPSSKLEKYLREDLRYADTVEVPFEDISAELEEYHKRLLRCGCDNKECDCKKKIPKKKRPSK